MTTNADTTQPCTDCNPSEIDDLTCESAKIEKQAEVTRESLEKLDAHRDQFATARATYTTAWATARADVTSACEQLEALWKDLRCDLEESVRTRLKAAWDAVQKKIEKCNGPTGCRVGECTPNSSVGTDDTQASLAGRIQALRQDAADRGVYFDQLVTEQTELPSRAATAKQLVADIAAAMKADPPTDGAERLYVRALVAEWRLETVGGDFDSVASYVDCLCRALMCELRTWKAIVALEGAKAEKACQVGREADACTALRADPVAAVLAQDTAAAT